MVSKQQNKYNHTIMSMEGQFKDFLEKEFKIGNDSLLNMVAECANNDTLMLSDNVIEFIKVQNGLTTEEAKIISSKTQQFNELFIAKYPDNYFEHIDEIITATKKYGIALLAKIKRERK